MAKNYRYEYYKERQPVKWLEDFANKYLTTNGVLLAEEKTAGYHENILKILEKNKKNAVEDKVNEYKKLVGLDMIDNIEKESNNTQNNTKEAARNKNIQIGSIWQANDLPEIFAKILEITDEYSVLVEEVDISAKGRYFREGISKSTRNMNIKELLRDYSYWGNPGSEIPSYENQLIMDHKAGKHEDFKACPLCQQSCQQSKMATKTGKFALSSRHKLAQEVNTNTTQQYNIDNIKKYISEIIKNRNGAIASPAIIENLEKFMRVDKEWLIKNYDKVEQLINDTRKSFTPEKYNEVAAQQLARTDEPTNDKDDANSLSAPSSPLGSQQI